jgi:mannose-6-phosphate isomerase-like protein (cupin superfamily)
MEETQQRARGKQFEIDADTLARIEAAETGIETFAYARPDIVIPVGKKIRVKLAATDSTRAQVQVLNAGGENSLHYHANVDLIYMVISGKVEFYGAGDKLLGTFGALQGIKFPQYARYWFKSVGEEEAALLQISGYPRGSREKERILCEPVKGPHESTKI